MNQICEVVIDQTGTIKLPDYFLAESGLRPGVKMTIQMDAQGEIRLCPHPPIEDDSPIAEDAPFEIVEEAGHLFVRGVKPFDLNKLIEEEREARMTELMQGIQR